MQHKQLEIVVNTPSKVSSNSASESTQTEPSDRDLVSRCQQGDLGAYEILVNRYRTRVYSLAFGMLRNEQDATDLCQDAFIRGWQAIRKFQQTSSFYTWLYRITTNLCIDFVRRRNRKQTVPFEEAIDPDSDVDVQEPPSTNPSPTDEAQRGELRAQIDRAMLELSPEHRAVVQLREFDGLDYAEIAKAVGISIGTVMSRLHYARKHLQKLLKDAV